MKKESANIELHKKLICDLVLEMSDPKFLRQLYSLLFREKNRTGRIQRELHAIIEQLEGEDLRLLYIAAVELSKK